MKRFAFAISWLLHPLLMPLYVLIFLFQGNTVFAMTPGVIKWYCYGVTMLFLLGMPLLSLPLFRRFHFIRDYGLEDRRERVYPILIVIGFAFLGFWLLSHHPYTHIIQQLYLILIVLLSAFSVITLRWKISMHMTAIGAACGILLVVSGKNMGNVREWFILFLLLSGLLASSRLYLKKHTPLQVYAGFLLGIGMVVGILW